MKQLCFHTSSYTLILEKSDMLQYLREVAQSGRLRTGLCRGIRFWEYIRVIIWNPYTPQNSKASTLRQARIKRTVHENEGD